MQKAAQTLATTEISYRRAVRDKKQVLLPIGFNPIGNSCTWVYHRNMPVKNTVKLYDIPAYYHVYNRGIGDQPIFREDSDRIMFLTIVSRHLDDQSSERQGNGQRYPVYAADLVAYCLMGNHFHFLLYQEQEVNAISAFMRSVGTAYTMYFNKKYKQNGHLFQTVYKASRITDDAYLAHITRYIHMNPGNYFEYPWSSLQYYLRASSRPTWLHIRGMMDGFSPERYKRFLREYEDKKEELALLKAQLAD